MMPRREAGGGRQQGFHLPPGSECLQAACHLEPRLQTLLVSSPRLQGPQRRAWLHGDEALVGASWGSPRPPPRGCPKPARCAIPQKLQLQPHPSAAITSMLLHFSELQKVHVRIKVLFRKVPEVGHVAISQRGTLLIPLCHFLFIVPPLLWELLCLL